MTDPILEELWKIKDGLAEECGHDSRRLFDRFKAEQKSQADHVVIQKKDQSTTTARHT